MTIRDNSHILHAAVFRRKLSDSPLTLIDVGARDGIHPRWKAFQPNLRVIGFEPDEDECAALNSRFGGISGHDVFIPTALSDKAGQAEMYVTRKPACSSFLRPNYSLLRRFPQSDRFEVLRTSVLRTDRLDDLLDSRGWSADFLKLDVQGTELEILRGASKTLKEKVVGVEVEVEFVELYNGQPLFGQVDEFLRSLGFSLFDLSRSWWKRRAGEGASNGRGQLVYADALYLRDYAAESEPLQQSYLAEQGSRTIKAIAISIVYDKLDFAMELVRLATDIGDLTQREAQELERLLSGHGSAWSKIPNFRGRGRLATLLGRLADELSPLGWSRSEND